MKKTTLIYRIIAALIMPSFLIALAIATGFLFMLLVAVYMLMMEMHSIYYQNQYLKSQAKIKRILTDVNASDVRKDALKAADDAVENTGLKTIYEIGYKKGARSIMNKILKAIKD
jgi:cell division protein FtsL